MQLNMFVYVVDQFPTLSPSNRPCEMKEKKYINNQFQALKYFKKSFQLMGTLLMVKGLVQGDS